MLGRGCGDSPGLAAPPVLLQGRGLTAPRCLGGAQRRLHHLEEKPRSREHSSGHRGYRKRVTGAAWSGVSCKSFMEALGE